MELKKSNMSRIIFLIPYFGKWPIWVELYLDSIKRNPTIDFLFITDCDTSILEEIPNVKYQKISFLDYIEKYKSILGNDIQIPNAYKICDLRPFFALVHQEDIQGYDFFGWTDTDLFFGDIRSFYTTDILSKYDVLSTHEIRLSGHCALLRNSSYHRNIGFKIYRWKEALTNPEFVGIDEHGITNALQMTVFDKLAEKLKFSKENFICKLLRKWKTRKHYFVEQYTTPFTPISWIDGTIDSQQPEEWYYHQGMITNKRDAERKFIYLHLMNFKSNQWRHDKTSAPWENGFIYDVNDLSKTIKINSNGIQSV